MPALPLVFPFPSPLLFTLLQYEFLKPYWDPISDGAKEFVKKMLIVDPAKRATCAQLLEDPWLSGPRSENEAKLHTHKEMPAAQEKLRKLKGAFLAAWAVQSSAEQ